MLTGRLFEKARNPQVREVNGKLIWESLKESEVKLLEFLADRGGLLPADRLLAAETNRLRMLLEIVKTDGIDPKVKAELMELVGGKGLLGEIQPTDGNELIEAGVAQQDRARSDPDGELVGATGGNDEVPGSIPGAGTYPGG